MKALYIRLLNSRKRQLVVLGLIWLLIQTLVFLKTGALISVDSDLYIGNAVGLLAGKLPQGRDFFYISYSLLLAGLMLMDIDIILITVFQALIACCAAYCIYELTYRYSNSATTAFTAALFYVLWFKFQQWNMIVYTDALFSSMAVISFYLLTSSKQLHSKFFSLLLIFFTSLLRPVGIGFLIAIAAYLSYPYLIRWHVYGRLLFTLVALPILNIVLQEYVPSILESYAKAEVIYPDIPFLLTKPESVVTPSEKYPALIRLVLFWAYQPLYMLRLSAVKLLLFVAHVKPYYSMAHNFLIICFLYPCYWSAYIGFRRLSSPEFAFFLVIFLGFQLITVSQTSENWDGRFLPPLLPWVFLLAAIGFVKRFDKAHVSISW